MALFAAALRGFHGLISPFLCLYGELSFFVVVLDVIDIQEAGIEQPVEVIARFFAVKHLLDAILIEFDVFGAQHIGKCRPLRVFFDASELRQ